MYASLCLCILLIFWKLVLWVWNTWLRRIIQMVAALSSWVPNIPGKRPCGPSKHQLPPLASGPQWHPAHGGVRGTGGTQGLEFLSSSMGCHPASSHLLIPLNDSLTGEVLSRLPSYISPFQNLTYFPYKEILQSASHIIYFLKGNGNFFFLIKKKWKFILEFGKHLNLSYFSSFA